MQGGLLGWLFKVRIQHLDTSRYLSGVWKRIMLPGVWMVPVRIVFFLLIAWRKRCRDSEKEVIKMTVKETYRLRDQRQGEGAWVNPVCNAEQGLTLPGYVCERERVCDSFWTSCIAFFIVQTHFQQTTHSLWQNLTCIHRKTNIFTHGIAQIYRYMHEETRAHQKVANMHSTTHSLTHPSPYAHTPSTVLTLMRRKSTGSVESHRGSVHFMCKHVFL